MDATKFIMFERACSDAFWALVSPMLPTMGPACGLFSCAAPKDDSEFRGPERIPLPCPAPVIKELTLAVSVLLDRIDAI